MAGPMGSEQPGKSLLIAGAALDVVTVVELIVAGFIWAGASASVSVETFGVGVSVSAGWSTGTIWAFLLFPLGMHLAGAILGFLYAFSAEEKRTNCARIAGIVVQALCLVLLVTGACLASVFWLFVSVVGPALSIAGYVMMPYNVTGKPVVEYHVVATEEEV